jgi:hypothetical protein
MNIFVLDYDPKQAARFHCDKHVVKMILESAQIMSACHELCGGDPWYRLTHKNHPCTVWARESTANYQWLLELFNELCEVYTEVYGRQHKCSTIEQIQTVPPGIPDGELTSFVQAMPDEFIDRDPVTAYRRYYRIDKAHILKYKSRPLPAFLRP